MEGPIVNAKIRADLENLENTHSEIGDSIVDGLLLRYLPCGESYPMQAGDQFSLDNW